jgi:transposase-like protein
MDVRGQLHAPDTLPRGRYLHLQGKKISERGTSLSSWLQTELRRYIPPKRLVTQYLHGATSQKSAFFIFITVKPQISHNLCLFRVNNVLRQSVRCVLIEPRPQFNNNLMSTTPGTVARPSSRRRQNDLVKHS